jgi:hypothetical protein
VPKILAGSMFLSRMERSGWSVRQNLPDDFEHLTRETLFVSRSTAFLIFPKTADVTSLSNPANSVSSRNEHQRYPSRGSQQLPSYKWKHTQRKRERERERERGGGRAKRLLTRDAFFSFAKSLCVSHGYEQSPDALTMPLIDPHATHKTRTYYSPLRDRKSSALAA